MHRTGRGAAAKEAVTRRNQVLGADLISVAGHSAEAAPNTY